MGFLLNHSKAENAILAHNVFALARRPLAAMKVPLLAGATYIL